jgi:hypothetical protein
MYSITCINLRSLHFVVAVDNHLFVVVSSPRRGTKTYRTRLYSRTPAASTKMAIDEIPCSQIGATLGEDESSLITLVSQVERQILS